MEFVKYIVLLVLVFYIIECSGYNVYNIMNHGARGDGETDDTEAFLAAWNAACMDSTASTMLIPSGRTFVLNQVAFKGPCNSAIHIQIVGNVAAPNKVWSKNTDHWITISEINGLKIDGFGQIDGKGSPWWSCKQNKRCSSTPNAFFVFSCNDVEISDLTFVNGPRKHVSIYKTVRAQLTGLVVTAPGDSPNTDGIHIEHSQQVTVFESTIETGDDCISIGPGTSDININQIICGPGHGISIGSLGGDDSKAEVEQINVSNCKISNTTNGVRIKTWQGGSGYARRISFTNITFDSVQNPIIINQYYCENDDNCSNKTSAVQISDVFYNNLSGSSATENAITLQCSQAASCTDIVMENVSITSAQNGEMKASCFNAIVTIKGNVAPLLSCDT